MRVQDSFFIEIAVEHFQPADAVGRGAGVGHGSVNLHIGGDIGFRDPLHIALETQIAFGWLGVAYAQSFSSHRQPVVQIVGLINGTGNGLPVDGRNQCIDAVGQCAQRLIYHCHHGRLLQEKFASYIDWLKSHRVPLKYDIL